MKNRYIVVILLAIVSFIIMVNYSVDIFHFSKESRIINAYQWEFTGESFVTTFTDQQAPVKEAKNTHACLAWNDESCFIITVRSGNYASYFNAYWIAIYEELMAAPWSEVTFDDLKSQLKGGYIQVLSIPNNKWDGERHLVDIGLEWQHLYIERPRGTLIITDTLGMKGASYEDRRYIPYLEMPQYIQVK